MQWRSFMIFLKRGESMRKKKIEKPLQKILDWLLKTGIPLYEFHKRNPEIREAIKRLFNGFLGS